MKQLFSILQSFVLEIINNEIYVNILSIVVVSYTTYQVAKFNASKPQKLKIKQLQLQNVYLPLFRIFSSSPKHPSRKQALAILKKITNVLDSHYELAFPQLHRLTLRLRNEIMSGKDPSKTLEIIRHQISTDYELLKKSLGYPSESLLSVFVRMTFSQKIRSFQILFNVLLLMAPGILVYIFFWNDHNKPALILTAVLLFFIFFTISPLLGYVIRHFDD